MSFKRIHIALLLPMHSGLRKKKPPPKAGVPKTHGVVSLFPAREVFPHQLNLVPPTGTVPVCRGHKLGWHPV